ncbi:hypothetical protein ACFY3V_32775 [Streptosporangium sp. NPDC000095]|uniref:hypothetical protein n=1 Tax=Streptosporangium sp. NPDC000095 TaxID=3366184 RepID=UPI0036859E72
MGARPEQQLALNFLTAIHDLWVQYPGNYMVKESADDLVPALAQICIKALAADVRDGSSSSDQQGTAIDGQLLDVDRVLKGNGAAEQLTLRDVVNKIIHGTPTSVEVRNGDVLLHFRNNSADRWTLAWFSGTKLLQELGKTLVKHKGPQIEEREREIAQLLETLGVQRFLPSRDQ